MLMFAGPRRVGWLKWGPRQERVHSRPLAQTVLDDSLSDRGFFIPDIEVDEAAECDVVLITLMEPSHIWGLRRLIERSSVWKRPRPFTVIAGGAGAQNVHMFRGVADFVWFGRGEHDIGRILEDGPDWDSPHGCSPDSPHPVRFAQTDRPWQGPLVAEDFIGCGLKCKFCHYTFSRKWSGGEREFPLSQYMSRLSQGHSSPTLLETTIPQLIVWPFDWVPKHITVGVDGSSERLRWAFGKKIRDSEIVMGVEKFAEKMGERGVSGGSLKLFNIVGFPGETADDRTRFENVLRSAHTGNVGMSVRIQETPFQAPPATPMQWEAFSTDDLRTGRAGETIADRKVRDGVHQVTYRTNFLNSPKAQVPVALAVRADGSAAWDHAAKWWMKVGRTLPASAFPDVFYPVAGEWSRRLLGRLDVAADHPSMVSGRLSQNTLRDLALKLRGPLPGRERIARQQSIFEGFVERGGPDGCPVTPMPGRTPVHLKPTRRLAV